MLRRRRAPWCTALIGLTSLVTACSGGPITDDASTDRGPAPPDGTTTDIIAPDAFVPFDVTLPDAGGDAINGDTADARDAGRDVFVRDGPLLLPRCEDTEPTGPIELAPVISTLVGTVQPVGTRVSVANPLDNPSSEDAEISYRMRGLDRYRRGPAQARVVRRDFPANLTPPVTRASLAYFVAVSDFQLTDDESPTRWASLDNPLIGAGNRPQEAYIGRAMSALNRTLTTLSMRSGRPLEFGVFAGDCADNGQLNELRWFRDIMDGVPGVHLDSGADDDPVPGPDNDPKDPFDPVPFPAPWLYVPGNHDVEIVGIELPTSERQAEAMGTESSRGTRDYSRWYAPVRRGTVIADRDRRPVLRSEIVRELFASPATPGPVGHGYPSVTHDVSIGANYTRDLIPNVLRLIAFDTSDPTGGSKGLVRREVIDRFLRPELERAQRDGVLAMLTSHHPLDSIDRLTHELGPTTVSDAVSADEIQRVVTSYPNMFLWLVGHQHVVRVRAIRGPDADHPGFWEVQSGSVADWPSQARIMELVANDNGTLSIFGTMVDYEPRDCHERRFRRLTLMDFMSGWAGDHTGTAADRNVELVIPIPPEARARITAAMRTAPRRIESETTLRGM